MNALKQFLKRRRPRTWYGWINLLAMVLLAGQLLATVGTFSPIFSASVYPHLAPAGWHNITPHGNIVLNSFAASTSSPGLMLACGTSFSVHVTDPSTWRIGGLRVWISRDGGATWRSLPAPPSNGDLCDVSLGLDGSFATTIETSPGSSGTTWVSRDSGKTWRRASTNPTVVTGGKTVTITPILRRGAVIYGSYDTDDSYYDSALATSSDNGKSWFLLGTTPSTLVTQGWQVADDFVPDYRSDHWWYRTLSMDGVVPVLEHSTDDGRSWTFVAKIGSAFTGFALLGVNPSQPGHLCADRPFGDTDHVSLLSSSDGGMTWEAGTMPSAYAQTSGETSIRPAMDAVGNCYQGYHYGVGGLPGEGITGSHYVILRLAPHNRTLQPLSVTRGGEDGNLISEEDIVYVPTDHGMTARLVIEAWISYYRSWAALFSGLAGETDDGQLLWTAAP